MKVLSTLTTYLQKLRATGIVHSKRKGLDITYSVFGKTPDEWIKSMEFLVNEGLVDVARGINGTHILQEFILMGVLV